LFLLLCSMAAAGCFNSMERTAPPEKAASPEEILPPAVFRDTQFAHGEVTQVVLDLNPEAKHQFGYDFGGSRMAIFTILEAAAYDRLYQNMEEAYQQALSEDSNAVPPKFLDDVGEGAFVYGTNAVFKKGGDCGIILANILLDSAGDPVVTLTPEELEKLVRIAASRM